MRKIIASVIIIFLGISLFAQDGELENLYYSYKGEEGVVALRIPGFVLRLAGSIADLDNAEKQLLRSMRSVQVLTIDEPSYFKNVNFVDEINLDRLTRSYQLLLQVIEEDEEVLILAREKRGAFRDIVILVGGSENVMVRIRGRMNSDLIGSIADVAGIDELKYTRGI